MNSANTPNTTSASNATDDVYGSPLPEFGAGQKSRSAVPELRVYEGMAEAVNSSIEKFLEPLQPGSDLSFFLKSMTREEFFPRFYSLANRLADDCCQKLVKIIRASSQMQSVRDTPTPDLAKRIRETAFRSLDDTLSLYAGIAKRMQVLFENIRKVRDEIQKPSAAPAGNQGKDKGGAPENWATDEELARQHEVLLRAQSQAFARIAQYLKSLDQLPENILNYACDKCFPGEVNFELLHEQVADIRGKMQRNLASAIETLAQVGGVAQQELGQERSRIMSNVATEKLQIALEELVEDRIAARRKSEEKFRKYLTIGVTATIIVGALVFWLMSRFL